MFIIHLLLVSLPILVPARSKAGVYGRSLARIADSNPAERMSVVSVVC